MLVFKNLSLQDQYLDVKTGVAVLPDVLSHYTGPPALLQSINPNHIHLLCPHPLKATLEFQFLFIEDWSQSCDPICECKTYLCKALCVAQTAESGLE